MPEAETSVNLREFSETDWPELARLANTILPDRPQENQKWLDNVRAFDASAHVRRRHTAVDRDGVVVGYGSLEQDPGHPSRYRLRLLMEGPRIARGEAAPLMDELEQDLQEVHATAVWERVDRDEPELLDYLGRRGLRVVTEMSVGPYRYVHVERSLPPGEHA